MIDPQLAKAHMDQIATLRANVRLLQSTKAHLGHTNATWANVGTLSVVNAQLQDIIDELNGNSPNH